MKKPVHRVAMIGAGMVADAHLQSIAELPDKMHLAGVLSSRAVTASQFARRASEACGYEVKAYSDLAALANDAAIDWVVVLTPPNARQEIIDVLTAAGKPILMEKPIERNFVAAQKIVQQCESNGVQCGVVFQHRMREASIELRKRVHSGALGSLVIAEARVPWWREQSYYDEPGRGTLARDGGGVLISQAIHTLDLLLSLTGAVEEVSAIAHTTALHQMETEDYVSASLRFCCGAVGSLTASTAHYPGEAESITLHFSKCVAQLQSGELLLSWRDGRVERLGADAATGGGADPMAFTHTWHRDIIADFSDALRENRPPCVTGREALAAHALIEALIDSSKQGRVVSVPSVNLSP